MKLSEILEEVYNEDVLLEGIGGKNFSKQWKIGEYAIGGIIKVSKKGNKLILQALDYNSKKVVKDKTIDLSIYKLKGNEDGYKELGDLKTKISFTIDDWSTSYYGDKIATYVMEKLGVNKILNK